MHVVKLDLPPPADSTVEKIKQFVYELPKNDQAREWLNQFYHNEINAVDQSFQLFDNIKDEVNAVYKNYFKCNILPVLGIMKNVAGDTACLPPHCDRARYTAINYYIELGGSNVVTNFYNYHRPDNDLTEAKNILYNELELEHQYCFEQQQWYAYNVQQCHSVENVETTRIALMLGLETNLNFENFKLQYHHLFLK